MYVYTHTGGIARDNLVSVCTCSPVLLRELAVGSLAGESSEWRRAMASGLEEGRLWDRAAASADSATGKGHVT